MIGGTGAMRAECMSVQGKVTACRPANGSGQMNTGLWKPNLTSLTRTAGSMPWISQGSSFVY